MNHEKHTFDVICSVCGKIIKTGVPFEGADEVGDSHSYCKKCMKELISEWEAECEKDPKPIGVTVKMKESSDEMR
jgi:hypothetical protein